ncbi:hypothetical protein TWF718_002431 [Orbilia javanica]|uniref:Uncharacterized protein n=1 Tax=Orbilia javanica TaxID=47235 RepID=A0AAN8RJR2_9PEZI
MVLEPPSSPAIRAIRTDTQLDAREYGIGIRHGGRGISTMPNIHYNRQTVGNTNEQIRPPANPAPPAVQDRRAFSAEEPFASRLANAQTTEIRSTTNNLRMPKFGQGDARAFENYNTIQNVQQNEHRSSDYQIHYPVRHLGPPQVVPDFVRFPERGPPNQLGALMPHIGNYLPGPSGPLAPPGQLHLPNVSIDDASNHLTQPVRNSRPYDEYDSARQRLEPRDPRNPHGHGTLRQHSAPHLSNYAPFDPEIEMRARYPPYAIDPTGHLNNTPTKGQVRPREAGLGFPRINEFRGPYQDSLAAGPYQGGFATGPYHGGLVAAQNGPSYPDFATLSGGRSFNNFSPTRGGGMQQTERSESPQATVFRRSPSSESRLPSITYTSTDTNENDENNGNAQRHR